MALIKRPRPEHVPLLERLREAALVREEVSTLYRTLFIQAVRRGIRPAIIARYAGISPQAANSTRKRIVESADDGDRAGDPETVDDIVQRAKAASTGDPERHCDHRDKDRRS
jgi:hypothetical protein